VTTLAPLLAFDLDGTLYRTASSFVPTMRSLYAEYGLTYPSDPVILRSIGVPFPAFLDWMIAQGFPDDRAVLAQQLTEVELASIRKRGEPFPGVRETLVHLREAGYAISLCTNGDRQYADTALTACGIANLFDTLQTNDARGTSKTELLRRLLERMPHDRAFMIGDRRYDVMAGRENGCAVIGASYGYGTADELANANHQIDSFPQLLTTLHDLRS